MLLTLYGQHFLQNDGILPSAWRPLQESHNNSGFVFRHFSWFSKVEPKWIFTTLVVYCFNYWSFLSPLSIILIKLGFLSTQIGIPIGHPNWCPVFSIEQVMMISIVKKNAQNAKNIKFYKTANIIYFCKV